MANHDPANDHQAGRSATSPWPIAGYVAFILLTLYISFASPAKGLVALLLLCVTAVPLLIWHSDRQRIKRQQGKTALWSSGSRLEHIAQFVAPVIILAIALLGHASLPAVAGFVFSAGLIFGTGLLEWWRSRSASHGSPSQT